MAESAPSIFNRKATERLHNPDDLDKYLRMTNPNAWVVLAACVALLVGLLVWGVFGTITPNVSACGVCSGGQVSCMVAPDDVSKLHEGDEALVAGVPLTVDRLSEAPLSRDEAKGLLGSDYLVSTLMQDDWAYVVTLAGDASSLPEGTPLEVTIAVDHIAPITLVLGGGR